MKQMISKLKHEPRSWNDQLSFIKKIFNIEERIKNGYIWNYEESTNDFGHEVKFDYLRKLSSDNTTHIKITKQHKLDFFWLEVVFSDIWCVDTQIYFQYPESKSVTYIDRAIYHFATKDFIHLISLFFVLLDFINVNSLRLEDLPILYNFIPEVLDGLQETAFGRIGFNRIYNNLIGLIYYKDSKFDPKFAYVESTRFDKNGKHRYTSLNLPYGLEKFYDSHWMEHTGKIKSRFDNKEVFEDFVEFMQSLYLKYFSGGDE